MSKPGEWRVDQLVCLFVALSNPDIAPAMKKQRKRFIRELESIISAMDRHEYNVNFAANSGIMARLIHFH